MLNQFILPSSAPLSDAIKKFDEEGCGTVFAVDENNFLVGSLSLGDVENYLSNGANLDEKLVTTMKTDCFRLALDTSEDKIKQSFGGEVEAIPLVNEDGHLSDVVHISRFQNVDVAETDLSGNELKYLTDCISENWISSQGPYVTKLEKEFVKFTGVEHALTTSNGTTALHLALLALEIGPGDEVIVPDLTFAASINSILYTGATPVLVDVDIDTWTLDIIKTREAITPKTKALMPVHLYGQPADMQGLKKLADEFGLLIVEDAAEALGSVYHNQHVGQFGDAAAFSFFGNKLITTGEGGMVTFLDPQNAERAKILRDHGARPGKRYWHDVVGFNYRMTNIQAAIGCAQFERINSFISKKLEIGSMYSKALEKIDGIRLPSVRNDVRNVYWTFSLILDFTKYGISRNDLLAKLSANGIDSRPLFYPLHQMKLYRKFATGKSYDTSAWLSANGLSLPTATSLDSATHDYVCESFSRILRARQLREINSL